MNNHYARKYLYKMINSSDDDLSARDKQEMQGLRDKTSDLGLLTIHASFCDTSLDWKTCVTCNMVKEETDEQC